MPDYTLHIPAPAEWLNSNDRGHWTRRDELTRTWRYAATVYAIKALRRGDLVACRGQVEITATIHRATRRGRSDAPNRWPTVKACIDALVDAKVLIDDSDRYVLKTAFVPGEQVDGGRLTLTITDLSGQGAE